MKLAVAFLAVLGLACALPAPQYNLRDDADDILALIPTEKVIALYHKYQNDADVKKIVEYLKSEDFAKVVHIVVGVDEVKDLVSYLESKGLHVIDILNKIADRLGLPHWPGSYHRFALRSTYGWRDFLEEFKQIVPLDKIRNTIFNKLANSEDFQALYEKIASLDYQKLHDQALSHPEIVDMINRLKEMGVDVEKILQAVKDFFGWGYSTFKTRSLRNDMDDILALIPTDKVIELYHKYENDADVKKIVDYLKSKDFAAVVHIVVYVPEVQEMVNYLEERDIKVIKILNKMADRLGLPHWPGSYNSFAVRSTYGWRDFLDEFEKIVPLEKIRNTIFDKLANSEDFQALYEKIASLDYQKLHDQALSHPEIGDMINRLKEMGVDVDKIEQAVKDFFGWN